MSDTSETIKVTMHETQGCLVVPIQEELSKESAQLIQGKILQQVHACSLKGVVIDLSGVEIIDSILWEVFTKTTHMIKMLGCPTVITGLSPGVVASIIDLNIDLDEITTAMRLEDGLDLLVQSPAAENVEDSDTEIADDPDDLTESTEEIEET